MSAFWRVTFETPMTSTSARFLTVDEAFRWLRQQLDEYIVGARSLADVVELNSSISYEKVP
jgi:hypothetical protein